jgi:hypothetical protein
LLGFLEALLLQWISGDAASSPVPCVCCFLGSGVALRGRLCPERVVP